MFFRLLILACLMALTYSAVWNLFYMKQCSGGKSLLYYNEYGCNCGLARTYNLPVDDVDVCCIRHRGCYNVALESGDCKSRTLAYMTSYAWKCVDNNPACIEKPEDQGNVCAAAICECDRKLVECWKDAVLPPTKPNCPYDLK